MDKIKFIQSIKQHAQKSQEWLEQRKGFLTSSDAGTALGINPYEKPIKLLFKKNNAGEPFIGNVATFHGERYETEAIDVYCKLMSKKNYEFGLIGFNDMSSVRRETEEFKKFKRDWPDVDLAFLGGSVDGVAIDNDDFEGPIVLEVKCPFRRNVEVGYCPEYYYPQVQLNMAMLDIDVADFIEYIPAKVEPRFNSRPELNITRFHRDHDWFYENVPKLWSFWQEVKYWREVGIINHPEYEKHAYNPNKIKVPRVIKKKSSKDVSNNDTFDFHDD